MNAFAFAVGLKFFVFLIVTAFAFWMDYAIRYPDQTEAVARILESNNNWLWAVCFLVVFYVVDYVYQSFKNKSQSKESDKKTKRRKQKWKKKM